jgi:hypothetical protein
VRGSTEANEAEEKRSTMIRDALNCCGRDARGELGAAEIIEYFSYPSRGVTTQILAVRIYDSRRILGQERTSETQPPSVMNYLPRYIALFAIITALAVMAVMK